MNYYPITVVDNFYENPDLVRDYALSLNYRSSADGKWPGVRTNEIADLNPRFFKMFVDKILSLFFDLEYTIIDWEVETHFQKINPDLMWKSKSDR